MSTPFIERLRALRSLEDRLAEALQATLRDRCSIERGGNTIVTVEPELTDDGTDGFGFVRIDLTHLAQELARDL